jgi:nucleotide-binding universal stress UspA family protein
MIADLNIKLAESRMEKSGNAVRTRPINEHGRNWLAGGTILHPTDYSSASRQAYELACQLAREQGMRLVVLHVPDPVYQPFGMAEPPTYPAGYRAAWWDQLRFFHPAEPGVDVTHRLEEGKVADTVLRVAREEGSDVIVMARRDRPWWQRLVSPSVSGKVERGADCPVVQLTAPDSPTGSPMITIKEPHSAAVWEEVRHTGLSLVVFCIDGNAW